MTRLQNRRGFTLVEMLVAVTVLAVLSSFVFGVLTTSLAAGKDAERKMDINHTGRYLIDRLSQDLSSATLFPGSKRGRFVGRHEVRNGLFRDELHFTSFTRLYIGGRPLVDQSEIGYYFLLPEEGIDLLMRREADLVEEPVDRGGIAMEVTDRVKEIKLRYLGNNGWVENWHSETAGNKLPQAVSVEITLTDGAKDYFFSTVVRLPSYA